MGLLDKLLVVVTFLHIITCPYTKVEESFNLQAMHDILYHGTDLDKYDHHEFPGVVPRSFLGPLFISVLVSPFVYVMKYLMLSKFCTQYIVRMCLGSLVCYSFLQYKKAVTNQLGHGTGRWLLLLTITQFHFLFYASRPLPNVFALALALMSIQYCIRRNHAGFIWCAACAVIVFRVELALLLGIFLVIEIGSRRLSFGRLIIHAGPAGILWLAMTVLVDSVFWRHWLWPEGEVFWYNTVLNKSSNWGTSPFLWYFYSVLPRVMCGSLLFLPLGIFMEKRSRSLAIPALLFIFFYSFLPHKELRFIIYVFPLLNTVAAVTCNRFWQNRSKSLLRWLLAVTAVGHLIANLAFTGGLMYISHHNYSGGEAISQLHRLEANNTAVKVHIDVATAQTGVSRFTQLHPSWKYDKTEDLPSGGDEIMSFTHLLIGASSTDSDAVKPYSHSHYIQHVIYGFSKLKVQGRQFPPVFIDIEPKIYLLKRKHDIIDGNK